MFKKILIFSAIVFCMIGTVYFGYLSYQEYKPVMIAESKKQILNAAVIKPKVIQNMQSDNIKINTNEHEEQKEQEDAEQSEVEDNEVKDNEVEDKRTEDEDSYYDRRIDFDILNGINQDIVGWICIPGTSIDYPILIGNTENEYLNKDFEGNKSILGSIFSYTDTAKNLSDARVILFGHNMKSYQMFGELKRYLEDEFRDGHTKMYVYTKSKTMEIRIFSIFVCDEKDGILWDDVELGSLEYQELLGELEERNDYRDIELKNISDKYNSQSFSLVTCKGNLGTSKRLIVTGIVVKEKYVF